MQKPAFQVVQVGGAIVTAVSSAISTSLNILGITNNAPIVVKWLPLIILILFFGFVVWAWYDMAKKIQKYEDKKPTVEITPKLEDNFARVNIKNTGQHIASFSVQISNWQGIEPITSLQATYEGKWRYTNDTKDYTLKSGEFREVDIIKNEGQTLDKEGKENDTLQKVKVFGCSSSWEARAIISNEVQFSMQIFAEPKLKSKFKKRYMLIVGNEGWEQFKEIQL